MQKENILIVEDEFIVANDLRHILLKEGYRVAGIAASVEQARKMIADKKPDWVLLDIMLKGDLTGIDLGFELKEQQRPFLYISANTNQQILEAAKQTEPYGFLVKPFREKDLFVMLDIARHRFGVETKKVTAIQAPVTAISGLIGESPQLKVTIEQIRTVAPGDTSVLITGESGTGKEVVAKAIHQLSARAKKPLITVNCGALPQTLVESELFGYEKGAFTGANQRHAGKFEQADGGTVFLDEIGELPLEMQVKLLRVLQEKEIERLGSSQTIKVDIRIIAATNRNLEKEVAEGRFRLDLYYRLNVFPIELTPLRGRKKDIPLLARHFLQVYSTQNGKQVNTIDADTMEQFMQYNWPGNIREMQHLIERNVLFANGEILKMDLPKQVSKPVEGAGIKTMEELERDHIVATLQHAGGKVSGVGGAAELLGIPAQTLYSKMKKLGIRQQYN
ncbi:sigma-54 dependent transcriptional regulator [Terrimonas sp. NA20]|uniref:Sigma-54 dependent transcriptional regulator n=1 Tax=Terrimonas ginsenosidimutans TaxID=2908004 RepID=A0ABS9KKJ8_9BACT|nr:sigma-54 dependent transcriptional regulator [Terrimonas ginsenosidimutans]MCG2612829.1 sigma-54 dependent transcriptional regulator [Terrimonas ginsenosidimutans]